MSFPWATGLKIPTSALSEWLRQVPHPAQLLSWCLENNKIPLETYFAWARDHYGLPSLHEEFFAQDADLELWEQIQSVANWSAGMIPIRYWDGVVFIACVEPPSGVNWSFPVQYVLAAPQHLQKYWSHLAAPAPAPARANGPDSPPPPLVDDAEPDEAGFELSSEDTSAALKPPPHPTMDEPEDEPVGLAKVSASKPPPPPADSSPSIDMPQGLNLNFGSKSDTKPAASASQGLPEGLDFSKFTVPMEPDTTPSKNSLELGTDLNTDINIPDGLLSAVSTTVPVGPAKNPSFPPPPPPPPEPEGALVDNLPTAEYPAVGESSVIRHGTTATVRAASPIALEEAKSEDEVAAWAFKELRGYFDKCMILIFEGHLLRVWKHDNSWEPESPNAVHLRVDTNEPSLFRIVRRTGLPYHGRVANSDINDQFFKAWNGGQIPAHVTALPLKVQTHMVGILLGAGTSAANSQKALEFAETIADQAIQGIQKTGKKAA